MLNDDVNLLNKWMNELMKKMNAKVRKKKKWFAYLSVGETKKRKEKNSLCLCLCVCVCCVWLVFQISNLFRKKNYQDHHHLQQDHGGGGGNGDHITPSLISLSYGHHPHHHHLKKGELN